MGDLLMRIDVYQHGHVAALFAVSLPPPLTWQEFVSVGATIRRDLKLAVASQALPADAKFWIRESSYSPIISIEFAAWAGVIFADEYATALMESTVAKGPVQWTASPLEPPQDARLSREFNDGIALVRAVGDRRVAELMAQRPVNFYGPIQYQLAISATRLLAAAERGLRLEADPEYASFVERARGAAKRLGRRAERSLCGEGGVDLSSEQKLEELVKLDEEAHGRPVVYNRRLGRWVVAP